MTKIDQITKHRGFFAEIARKHGVNPSYVCLINARKRPANTKVAKDIVKDLRLSDELYRPHTI